MVVNFRNTNSKPILEILRSFVGRQSNPLTGSIGNAKRKRGKNGKREGASTSFAPSSLGSLVSTSGLKT
jgi:hypothetical protein